LPFEQFLSHRYSMSSDALRLKIPSESTKLLEKAMTGPSKELADRAQVHLRITEQRDGQTGLAVTENSRGHYQARRGHDESGTLGRGARPFARGAQTWLPRPILFSMRMAALDCLTGEAESAMEES